jgi:TonB family protein
MLGFHYRKCKANIYFYENDIMNYIVIFLTTALCFNGLCQSKKEQIAMLNYRLDSLSREYGKDTNRLNKEISILKSESNSLTDKYQKAEHLLLKKSQTIQNKNEKIQSYISNNRALNQEINQLRGRINQTKFHEVSFPNVLINKLWSFNCQDAEAKGNIYIGTAENLDDTSIKRLVEIGGYEWGGDVLRTESNATNDHFKAYFIRRDDYGHRGELQVFEFSIVNNKLTIDGVSMTNCNERYHSIDDASEFSEEIIIEGYEEIPLPPPDVIPPAPPVEQKVERVAAPIVEFPDVEAYFPGGPAAMMKWIKANAKYPQTSIEMNEQGRVFLSCIVEKDGSITNVKVERGVSIDLDREAKRVVRKMPKWIPGEQSGKTVKTIVRIPISFKFD